MKMYCPIIRGFNTQPPEGGWGGQDGTTGGSGGFNTQPPEGGWMIALKFLLFLVRFQHAAARRRLVPPRRGKTRLPSFNTQPPEGGWDRQTLTAYNDAVSTRSRPKAAGLFVLHRKLCF